MRGSSRDPLAARTVGRYRTVVKITRAPESSSRRSTCALLYAVSSGTATPPSRSTPR